MNRLIPGTTMKFSEQARESAFSLISPVLEATGGLTLSQLSKLTGLEGTTIQNWIKRGWVSATKGKKYSEKQILRILLINMLRKAMKLEDIANLMRYINGDVEDTSDDIVEEVLLYDMLCRIIFTAEDEGTFDSDHIKSLVAREVAENTKEIADDDKMKKAMFVMVMGYRSGFLRTEMEKGLEIILDEM
jgi:DNA-binding transcriptional MerR regulator